ncbi:hypothetical protein XaC1_56 [Xanthomonas phage XaC1]|nr:hypothetical protein XaC1_56 [Xanthomonas phage XaC1]
MYLPNNVSLISVDGSVRISKCTDEVNPYLVYHLGTCTVHKSTLEEAIDHCTKRYQARFPKETKVLAKDIKRGMIVCTEGYPYGSVKFNNRNVDEDQDHRQLVLFSQDTITLDSSAVLTVLK